MIVDAFKRLLGDGGVLTDPADIAPFCTDWKQTTRGVAPCVLRPRSTAEVAAIMHLCREAGVALVPQGGNTGMASGAIPDSSGAQLVLSLARMNAVRAIDPLGMTIEVEAGCVVAAAKAAAAAQNRLLPISLGSEGSAQIGGVVATNAGGINVLRYGMVRQLVLGLEVVEADGTIVDGLRHLRKDNAGYDWKQLFIGSEGTLGIVTAAVLRLLPNPRHAVTSLLAVPDPERGVALLAHMLDEIGDAISAFELIARRSFDLVETHLGAKPPLTSDGWFVLLEASASLPGLRDGVEAALEKALLDGLATDAVIAESESQTRAIWALRESISEAELKAGRSVKHDVSVPIPRLPAFIRETCAALAVSFPQATTNVFGHAGDGNLHFNVLVPEAAEAGAINRLVHDLCIAHGGSISAEHGIGSYRVAELAHYRAGPELRLARRIKNALDPNGLLNPGKVLAACEGSAG